jgi:hypothetical protein
MGVWPFFHDLFKVPQHLTDRVAYSWFGALRSG